MPYDSISEPLKKLGRVKNEMGWDYEGPTKGVKIQPDQNSDPLWIEFDKDNYIQEYCKTQFAGIDVHCTKPTDMNGISSVADGINHAVPTHKELQTSIAWLIKNGLIVKQGRNYELTTRGSWNIKQPQSIRRNCWRCGKL
ncbi:MAG: hypothetical protein IPG90_18650 [Bacteroidetes bacterium]|nr:hypothetical protein [Bacteroidota bacterium]